MQRYDIVYYETPAGACPFVTWHNGLRDTVTRVRIMKRLERVMQGNTGDCKRLTGTAGVHELRLDFGSGYRLYFGIDGKTLVVMLCGGDKRSQRADIARAADYWQDYLKRKR